MNLALWIVPAALGIAPMLVALPAVGVALMTVGALTRHLRGHEAVGVELNFASPWPRSLRGPRFAQSF